MYWVTLKKKNNRRSSMKSYKSIFLLEGLLEISSKPLSQMILVIKTFHEICEIQVVVKTSFQYNFNYLHLKNITRYYLI